MRAQSELMRQRGYLGVPDVSRLVGLTSTSVYRLVDDGRLREIKIGRARYIEVASLVEYLGPEGSAILLGALATPPPKAP